MSKCFKDTHPPFTVAPTQNVSFRIATPLLQKLRRAGGGGQVTRPLPSVLYSTASFLLLHFSGFRVLHFVSSASAPVLSVR